MIAIMLIMMLMIEVNLYIVIDFYLYNHCSNTMEQFETRTHIAKKQNVLLNP
jgi:hypothetical protein